METDPVVTGAELAAFARLTGDTAAFDAWWQLTAEDLGLLAHPEVAAILGTGDAHRPFVGPSALWPSVADDSAWRQILLEPDEVTPQAARFQWRRAWREFCSGRELIALLYSDGEADLPRVFLRARMGLLAPSPSPNVKLLRIVAQIAAGRWRIVRGEPEHPDARRYEAHRNPLAIEAVAIAQEAEHRRHHEAP